jgi:hypothetical protein
MATVKYGLTTSCGCRCREITAARSLKHGFARRNAATSEYQTWTHIKGRCHNPKDRAFKWYGARGIQVCERWRASFEDFLADMGPRPPGLQLERTDNNKGYSPDNCRWATKVEQMNNMRQNRPVGGYSSIAQAARAHGIKQHTIAARLRRGWSSERAMTEPLHR